MRVYLVRTTLHDGQNFAEARNSGIWRGGLRPKRVRRFPSVAEESSQMRRSRMKRISLFLPIPLLAPRFAVQDPITVNFDGGGVTNGLTLQLVHDIFRVCRQRMTIIFQ